MVGAFDDSAALAAAIVVEEYMKQIVGDLLAEKRSMFSLSKASIQAFASQLLRGFNWAFFFSPEQRARRKDPTRWGALVSAIYEDFVAVEKLDETTLSAVKRTEIHDWIREMVVLHNSLSDGKRVPYMEETSEAAEVTPDVKAVEPLLPKEFVEAPTPHVRVGVHRGAVLGNPSYQFTLKSKLAGDHYVRVSVDNIESEQHALRKIEKVKKALVVEHKRIWRDVIPMIPVVLQKQRAAALEFETNRKIMKLPKKVKRYFDMKDETKRDEHERRKQRWNEIYARKIAAKGTRGYKLHMERLQRRKDERAANRRLREAALATKRQQRKEERTRKVAARKRRFADLFNQKQEERKVAWTKMVEAASMPEEDPNTNELIQQLRQQVREARGSPSSRLHPGSRKPWEITRQASRPRKKVQQPRKRGRRPPLVLDELPVFGPQQREDRRKRGGAVVDAE